MGCNTSQEQPQSTLNVNNEGDTANEGNDAKHSADGPPVPSSTTSDKQNSADLSNETTTKGNEVIKSNAPKDHLNNESGQKPLSNGLDQDDDEEDEAQAAVKIQAAFRGHKVRANMKKGEPSDQTKQQNENLSNNKTEDLENKDEDLDNLFDPNDKELFDAATKIQATFRGHLQRKLVTETKDQVDIDEITKKVAEELDIDLNDPELNKAATKIQASFRGHKTRRTTPN